MTLRVAVFVGTRADLGPLSPVLSALAADDRVDLRVLTAVGYDAAGLVAALPTQVRGRDWWRDRVVAAGPRTDAHDPAAVTAVGPQVAAGVREALREGGSEVLVVLGDRWELLYVVPPAFLLGVRVVHLHGGEVTEGAVDERVRHAVTKLADQHCVASQDAARRLRQMGEPAERVHVTGAPGLDRLAGAEPLDDAELRELLGVPEGAVVPRPLALLTYHPPTAEGDAPVGAWARGVLEGTLDACAHVLATHPGMDPGRDEILQVLAQAEREEPRVTVVEALGGRYPRALRSVDVVVGNSSSGVIEAASAGVPAVDVGERQRGRLRGPAVVWADEGREPVAAAVREALTPAVRELARTADNPYGRGDAARRIVEVVVAAPGSPRTKPFVDVEAR